MRFLWFERGWNRNEAGWSFEIQYGKFLGGVQRPAFPLTNIIGTYIHFVAQSVFPKEFEISSLSVFESVPSTETQEPTDFCE